MSEKLTNEEILHEIGTMARDEANGLGLTADAQDAALRAGDGDAAALTAFTQSATPLFSAFCGFIVKFAATYLSKAEYRDVYRRHHRNMIDGRPELGFVYPATAGTGNQLNPVRGQSGDRYPTVTTEVTATFPDTIQLYSVTVHNFVARVPISDEDVKTAFRTPYGIAELYLKVREGLEDSIIEQLNAVYDAKMLELAKNGVLVGEGSVLAENAGKAVVDYFDESDSYTSAAIADDYSGLTDAELTALFLKIKHYYYRLTGRPSTKYNALGVPNNVDKTQFVCYIDSDVYTEFSRVKASLFNASELEADGLVFEPLKAPWLMNAEEAAGANAEVVVAALGSADFIRDWPTNDYGKAVPTDVGTIENRFKNVQLGVAGYEPFVFLISAEE